MKKIISIVSNLNLKGLRETINKMDISGITITQIVESDKSIFEIVINDNQLEDLIKDIKSFITDEDIIINNINKVVRIRTNEENCEAL